MNEKKTALVTGVAQGVGRATALEFGKLGHNLVIVDFNEDGLKSLEAELEAMDVQVTAFVCDVSNEARVREVCAAAVAEYGQVDILVNNAGLYRAFWGDFLDTTSDQWKRLFDVNVMGTMYFCHALLPTMLGRPGRIINVGSVAGDYCLHRGVPYSATKGAISSFTMALAKLVGDKGITVNSIVPGMIQATNEDGNVAGQQVNAVDRSGTPEECAKLIAFLASDEAAYITAQNIRIDGGRRKL